MVEFRDYSLSFITLRGENGKWGRIIDSERQREEMGEEKKAAKNLEDTEQRWFQSFWLLNRLKIFWFKRKINGELRKDWVAGGPSPNL